MIEIAERRLNALQIKCRLPVQHLLAGHYRSVFRGQGVEFEDVRLYQPGDDVRAMDWKVTARTGKPHVKRYIEEREQHIYLLVDLSASMLHNPALRKRAVAAEIGALLTFAAIENQDRVGLILFTEDIEHVIPPGKSRNHSMRILDALLNHKVTNSGTDLDAVLVHFGQMARKNSIVFVVSDFLTGAFSPELRALGYRHDVNAVRIADPRTGSDGGRGLVRIADAEKGDQRLVEVRPGQNPRGPAAFNLRQELLESNIDLLDLEPGSDCVEALAGFFHARKRREFDETGG